MNESHDIKLPYEGATKLGGFTYLIFRGAIVTCVASMILALVIAAFSDGGAIRLAFAYITNFGFFLSLALGALFFVLIQHVTKAGWSVGVRRVAEVIAMSLPMLFAAGAPIALAVVIQTDQIYPWVASDQVDSHETEAAGHDGDAHVGTDDHASSSHREQAAAPGESHLETPMMTGRGSGLPPGGIDPHLEAEYAAQKSAFLNPFFFVVRWVIYFAVWIGLALRLWWLSTRQDENADPSISSSLSGLSAPGLVAFALTVTFASFDLIMSLSPAWYSTIFGVYYFAGAAVGAFATLILAVYGLQKLGHLRIVTIEHYHDLGKFLFGFVFFYGYIAFSQYMLIWYASLPETTFWFAARGVSTAEGYFNGWSIVAILILFGKFLIPFAALMSRHVKRRPTLLLFWACWLLVFHWIDMWWLVMPEFSSRVHFGLPEILTFSAIGSLVLAGMIRIAAAHKLIPAGDPRLPECMAFINI